MARKKEISYFTDLSTEEDLDEYLKQDALLILDVYQDLLGPCSVGIHGSIEKIKINLPQSDALQLGAANATKIDKLKRFRGKSLPTMLFCRNGKCVDIVYGANIPSIARKVHRHLSMKDFGDNDKTGRYYFEFDEMVPEERAEFERKKAIEDEKFRVLHEAELMEKRAELDEIILLMKHKASDMGVTIFMPQVMETAQKKTHENSKWCSIINKAQKVFQLTPELYDFLSYRLDNPFDEKVLNYIYGKDILVNLWSTSSRSPMTKILKNFIESVAEPQTIDDDDGNPIPGLFKPPLLSPLYLDSNGEIIEMESKDEQLEKTSEENADEEGEEGEDVKSQESQHETENNIQDDQETTVIPPVWTPSNQPGNAVFMYLLFKNQFDSFLPGDEEETEPHICIVVPARKYQQAFEILQNFHKNDLMAFGFFEGDNFDDYKLLCKTPECYEKHEDKKNSDKFIMKVLNHTEHISLALAALVPLYMSLSNEEGEEDCLKIFNEEFEAHKDEIDSKKHPKREE